MKKKIDNNPIYTKHYNEFKQRFNNLFDKYLLHESYFKQAIDYLKEKKGKAEFKKFYNEIRENYIDKQFMMNEFNYDSKVDLNIFYSFLNHAEDLLAVDKIAHEYKKKEWQKKLLMRPKSITFKKMDKSTIDE